MLVALSGLCRKSQEIIGRDGILIYFIKKIHQQKMKIMKQVGAYRITFFRFTRILYLLLSLWVKWFETCTAYFKSFPLSRRLYKFLRNLLSCAIAKHRIQKWLTTTCPPAILIIFWKERQRNLCPFSTPDIWWHEPLCLLDDGRFLVRRAFSSQ